MKKYTITVTEAQLRLLNSACDVTSRIYRGIPDTIDLFNELVCVRGGSRLDREIMADLIRLVRKVINPDNRTDGKGQKYDAILHDMHQVIRNQMYKESGSQHYGVNSSVSQVGDEPLITINMIEQ